jgi:hypothetical protein
MGPSASESALLAARTYSEQGVVQPRFALIGAMPASVQWAGSGFNRYLLIDDALCSIISRWLVGRANE